MQGQPPWFLIAGGFLCLLCLFFAQRALRRKRLINDTPTSKTTGVFIGMTELKGAAKAESPLTSFLASSRCVHYSYDISEHWSRTVTETYRDSNGNTRTRTRRESGWKTVDSGGSQIPFYLEDDAGVIRILPEGAKIEPVRVFSETCGRTDPLYYGKGPAFSVMNSDHRRRFVEHAIPLQQDLFVVGRARQREDIAAAEVAEDSEASLYLISTRSEDQVSSGLGWTYFGLMFLGAGLLLGSWALQQNHSGMQPQPVHFIALGGIYGFIGFIAWAWMVYNSLVGLKNRVQQAASQIDVQLKRRADLIPRLINVVKGLTSHEQETQAVVTELRSQAGATAPGEEGANPHALKRHVIALAESYPEIKSDSSFMKLQENLIETEERIALARSYFNEITTFYNTRLEVVPDRFLAAMAGMKHRPLMEADEFERAEVKVSFAE